MNECKTCGRILCDCPSLKNILREYLSRRTEWAEFCDFARAKALASLKAQGRTIREGSKPTRIEILLEEAMKDGVTR